MAKRTYSKRPSFKQLESMSTADLRKAYTQMRDIWQKRLGRMQAKNVSEVQDYLPGGYKEVLKLSQLEARPGIAKGGPDVLRGAILMEAKNLVNLLGDRQDQQIQVGILSLQGLAAQRKVNTQAILETLHSKGKEHISRSQLRKFGRFMDAMREQFGKKNPGSEAEARWFDSLKYSAKRIRLSELKEMYERYVDNNYQVPKADAEYYRPEDKKKKKESPQDLRDLDHSKDLQRIPMMKKVISDYDKQVKKLDKHPVAKAVYKRRVKKLGDS